MSVRLSLLALSALLLSACDGNPLQAVGRQSACCCDHCPAEAAPAAKPGPAASRGGVTRAVATRHEGRVYRARGGSRTSYGVETRYESTSGGGYAGGYGGRYGARGGVSVSVSESESASARYSYSESSSGYAYGGGTGYAAGGAQVVSAPPRQAGYRGAQTEPDGYLTWPGKVED